jgi:formylglycine-generating enzyme required for sulfatase activity
MSDDFNRAIVHADAKTIREPLEKPEKMEVKQQDRHQETILKPRPAQGRNWGVVGIFAVIGLLLLGAGVWGVSAFLPSLSKPSQEVPATISVPNTTVPVEPSDELPDAQGMVEVTSDTYQVGLSPADEYHVTPQMQSIEHFWIDQYQVTNSQYEKFVTESGAAPPTVWPGDGDHPVRGVTWDQAVAYCGWLHKRLPTEAEWEAAGRGPGVEPRLYPWGNDPTAEGQALRLPDQDTYAVGTQSFNKSPFGVFDMVGNIWEWVGDPYNTEKEGSKVLRGGRFGLPVLDLAYRLVIAPSDTRYVQYAGFRCAAESVK